MVSKGFPNVTTSGRQYNIGEKPSVILYTYIYLHAGTPKPQSFLSKSFCFCFFLLFCEEKSQLPGFELMSQHVRRLRGYQLSYRGENVKISVKTSNRDFHMKWEMGPKRENKEAGENVLQ